VPLTAEKPPAPPPTPQPSAPRDPDIVVTLDYSTYSNVEALALRASYAAADAKEARERLAGFTLTAPEVELADTGSEVRITILSKVAR
jgi:hypothetical protein